MLLKILVTFCGCLAFAAAGDFSTNFNDGQINVKLFHAIGTSEKWSSRGNVIIAGKSGELLSRQEIPLSEQDAAELKKASAENGFYRVKAIASGSNGKEKIASTFIKACSLLESGLSDIITLTLDASGQFLGIAVCTTNPYCDANAQWGPTSVSKQASFNTTISVLQTNAAPAPDTQTYISRIEQEETEKRRGDKGDNKSFFAKYWMYIVPVVIFVLVSSATNPEGGAAGGGR